MRRRTRTQMLDETHTRLVEAGRRFFGSAGYAATSMDDLTASVDLTRGALYHHFGGKSGLLSAVVTSVDTEIDARLAAISAAEPDPLTALRLRCEAYIRLTQTPDVQQILFNDAPAVLPAAVQTSTAACVHSIAVFTEQAQAAGLVNSEPSALALAVLINGAAVDASRWVADAEEADRTTREHDAINGIRLLIESLRLPQ
ncbi:TetR/AcrR family transcriptional regulator [Spiractinospora alimapuensis]|uniref:TetR/AcrR family transcriptional regulator n=1 Tax=Spiractinospora alimapuensis TaxID=2820884 RepID=UPI001F23EE37|nr:TetR/AcrR family transcriptional regulator [Spiractinospora alimapuensis]QVQ53763.1 TetR/AcrR family transcriptional regulator [Spiractinospora alimapuensis]